MKPLTTTRDSFRNPARGTPISYTPEIGQEICARLMEGESLVKICTDPTLPTRRTVMNWLNNAKMVEFHEMYKRAREVQAEGFVDEIWEILNDDSEDYVMMEDKKGRLVMRPNHEHVQRTRMRIDAIKWYAGKVRPSVYGERVTQQHDVTGDLADLLKGVSNKDNGLPKPVE